MPTSIIPSFLNLYAVAIPENNTRLEIMAKTHKHARNKFWHQIGNPAFLHAKPVATLLKRGDEPR